MAESLLLGAIMAIEPTEMRQCECGAYRLAALIDDEWVWAAGCRACDKIERLYILLEGGVKVFDSRGASPERLRVQRDRAEAEIDRLKTRIAVIEEERDQARIREKRALHSANAAKAAMTRMHKGWYVNPGNMN